MWVTVWVRNFWPTHKVTFCNKKSPKTEVFGDFWSCYPDSNWGPHPYQLIGRMRFAAFQSYCALSSPECHPFQHSCVRYLRCFVSPCGSRCGSESPDLLQKLRQHIKDDGADHDPVGILIVVHQPVPKSGNLDLRDLCVIFLELIGQIVNVLPNVIQRCCDRPLNRFLIADFLWSNLFSLHIIQKLY